MKKGSNRLKLVRLGIDTYRENVAYLHRDCAIYRAEGFQALAKVEIRNGNSRILAVLNVVDDDTMVRCDEIGLSEQAFAQMHLAPGSRVEIGHAEPPSSMDAVRNQLRGERLGPEDYKAIVNDISNNRYSKIEMAAFVIASGQTGLDRDEVLYLTKAMAETGDKITWDEEIVADKHCIGGIPGNRTSMIVVPIVAAHGLLIPKTSSRAITSPSGTADTMEVFTSVELPPKLMRRVIKSQRGCLAWGGTAGLAPVDDILISVERPLGMDSLGQMVASILAKKIAAGSTHLLVDIPVGPTSKVRHMREALRLRRLFEYVGDRTGIHIEVILTDGQQPIGRGIGPVLEARDVLQVLHNEIDAPGDLRQKSLRLAGRIIEFDPDVRGGQGYAIARDILDSGRALEKFQSVIREQGKPPKAYVPGTLTFDVHAQESGVVIAIDNFLLAKIARMAGAPMDKGAGVDLFRKIGEKVKKGETIYRIYAEFPTDLQFARDLSAVHNGYSIGEAVNGSQFSFNI